MKMLKTIAPSNYLITYCQTLDEDTCLLRQEKIKYKCFEKTWKKLPVLTKNI